MSEKDEKRSQFGNRFLENGDDVFKHNAWDNVQWNEEQEKVQTKMTLLSFYFIVTVIKCVRKFSDDFLGEPSETERQKFDLLHYLYQPDIVLFSVNKIVMLS